MEKEVVIYSTDYCGYCIRAKRLLDDCGIEYEEIMASTLSHEQIVELMNKTKMRTFPQIFIFGKLVGGYTELKALDDKAGLSTVMQNKTF